MSLSVLRKFAHFTAVVLIWTVVTKATNAQNSPSLRDSFRNLVEHYNATVPNGDELLKVSDKVGSASPGEISDALPSIMSALKHREDAIKLDGIAILMAISYRHDSSELLKGYVSDIGRLLDSQNDRLQGITVLTFSYLKPEPPPEVAPPLLSFVRRTDRDPIAQADAFSLLLRMAPDNPDLTPTLQDFLARPMDEQTKTAVINDIANSHTENIVAINALIGALDDSSEQTRFAAAQAFQRMPREAIRRAQRDLQRVQERPDEAQEVKDAAKEALRMLEVQN